MVSTANGSFRLTEGVNLFGNIDNKIIPNLNKSVNTKSKSTQERNNVRSKLNKLKIKKENIISESGFKVGAVSSNTGTTIVNQGLDKDDNASR